MALRSFRLSGNLGEYGRQGSKNLIDRGQPNSKATHETGLTSITSRGC